MQHQTSHLSKKAKHTHIHTHTHTHTRFCQFWVPIVSLLRKWNVKVHRRPNKDFADCIGSTMVQAFTSCYVVPEVRTF